MYSNECFPMFLRAVSISFDSTSTLKGLSNEIIREILLNIILKNISFMLSNLEWALLCNDNFNYVPAYA